MKTKFVRFLMLGLFSAAITYTLSSPYKVAFYTHSAIKMCVGSLVPSLFIFMVFSRILSHFSTTLASGKPPFTFLSRLLNIPEVLTPVCITGLFCGAPSGAFAISKLYEKGYCTKKEAERACIFCGNCSFAFIFGFVSSVVGSLQAFYIFISGICASIAVYMLLFRGTREKNNVRPPAPQSSPCIPQILTESISSSVTATVTLCGYVIFFYTFTGIVCENLTVFLQSIPATEGAAKFINAAVCSLFEVSSGVLQASSLDAVQRTVLCAGAVSFTGLSMILQVSALLSKIGISSKEYFLAKCLCGILGSVFVILLLLISPFAVSVSTIPDSPQGGFSVSDLISLTIMTAIALTGAYILFCLDKKHKK